MTHREFEGEVQAVLNMYDEIFATFLATMQEKSSPAPKTDTEEQKAKKIIFK